MKIDHTGYLVRDIQKALTQFEALGYTRDTDIIEDSAARNVALCFLHNGGVRIELVSPLHNGRPSVVDATLQRQGDGPYHICYRLEQPMEDALADLRRRGWLVVTPPEEAVAFGGRRVAFLFRLGVGLIELVEADDETV